jgi:hypothetical protein
MVAMRLSVFVGMAVVCACAVGGCGSGGVPNGARLVHVASRDVGEQPPVAVTVTASAKVRRIVGWIDRMRPVPSGSYNCPAMIAIEPIIRLTFRAHPKGPVLARASEIDYGYGSFPCNPLTLTVPGRKPQSLIGGRFLERLQRLLGINLGFGEGTIKGKIYMAGGPLALSKTPLAGRVSLYLTDQPSRNANTLNRSETLPRPGQFIFTDLGPGAYYLGATVKGKSFDCPRVKVVVRAGKTTYANVPWGCTIG